MGSLANDIPRYFCWTRFGIEAAQSVEQIFARKEEERLAASGLFLWGVGNAIGRSLSHLLRLCNRPLVLFSSMKSPARPKDVSPPLVVAWASAKSWDGRPFRMPHHALVTSRFDPDAPKTAHYALVCHTVHPLHHASGEKKIAIRSVRNLATGRPIAPSQVTAIVRYDEGNTNGSTVYTVVAEAELVPPYFIRLEDPIPLRRLGDGECRVFDFAAAREEVRRRNAGTARGQLPLMPAT